MSNVTVTLQRPHPKQQEIIDCPARFIVMMAGRRFGKSVISQTGSITTALAGKYVAYITPTYALGKTFFREMCKALPDQVFKKNEQDLLIQFVTGGYIRFFTGERLDALRGLKFHLVVIDEASYISDLEGGWLNSIRPTLTDYKGRAIFLSTPKGRNYFYSLFLKSGEPDWQSFKFTTYDNPHIDPSEIDAAKAQLPAPVFEQEYMANPMENAANPFGSQHIRECIGELSTQPVAFYGIDLAKSVDYTVIIGMDRDGRVCHFDRFQKDWRQTREHILTLNKKVPVLIDSTGVGDPITEDLQREFNAMHGFKYSSTNKQQLMEGLASAIHQREITYPDGMIVQELEIFEYQFTGTGVKYSAPVGFHDDCVNALALCNRCRIEHRYTGKYTIL